MIQREHYELADFACLDRLKPNSRKVEAYWLPERDGKLSTAYLYQGDTYIGEAVNMEAFRYNEFAIERTAEDEAAMLHQQKRVAKFDKMIKNRRATLPQVGGTEPQALKSENYNQIVAEVVESAQPKNYEGDEFEMDSKDYAALAKEML